MAHELEVWLFADRVGTLSLAEGRLNFRYTSDWLSRPNAVTLSSALPLQTEPLPCWRLGRPCNLLGQMTRSSG